MKKSKIVIFVLAIVVTVVSVAFLGMRLHAKNENDQMKGIYFRNMYGSVGIAGKNAYSINLEMYSFGNCNLDFLKDPERLVFDNDNVEIDGVSYNVQKKEKDLVEYTVRLDISFANGGRQDVSALHYLAEDGHQENYQIGRISFLNKGHESLYLKHGCDTTINKDQAMYTFLKDNKTPFVIKNLILADGKGIKYSYKKNVSFTPGKELDYVLHVEYSGSDQDLFVVQPIFEIQFKGSDQVQYFSTEIPASCGKDLTYTEIKEYVKNTAE